MITMSDPTAHQDWGLSNMRTQVHKLLATADAMREGIVFSWKLGATWQLIIEVGQYTLAPVKAECKTYGSGRYSTLQFSQA